MILDLFNESNIFDVDDVTATNESLEPEIENAEATPLKEGESITDAYFRITLENVQNYNNIMNTVAVAEMAYMEKNGATSPVYEAADVKQFGHTIVEFVKKAWSKVKGLFESAIAAVQKIFTRDLAKEYEDGVKNKKINPSTTIKVKKGVRVSDINGIPDKVSVAISAAMNKLTVDTNMSKEDATAKSKEWKENKKASLDQVRGTVIAAFGGDSGACTSKDFSSKLAQAVSTKIEGEVDIKLVEAYNHLKSDKSVSDLRKAFKAAQKDFNTLMKEAKTTEKNARKGKEEGTMTAAAMNSNIIKECITVLNATSHQIIKLAGKQASMYKAVLKKGISAKGKDKEKKKEATHENADLICDLI